MKIDWNRQYTTIAMYSFIVIASSILFFLTMSGLEYFNRILAGYYSALYPFIYGFIIAYLVNFLLNFIIKLLGKIPAMKRIKKSQFHMLSLLLAYLISGFFVYLFLAFIFPQLMASVIGLVRNIPDYVRSAAEYIETISDDILLPPDVVVFINKRLDELAIFISENARDLVPMVLYFLRSTALSLWNVFLGIIISIYMLAEKERFISVAKKVNYGVFNVKTADKIIELSKRTQKIFSRFLGGKIVDSLIIGLIAFIVLTIVDMPYTLLVSFIITVTNIIPFFGPFIGAIPSVIIIFFESPTMAFWFMIIIFILQQLDGNVIGPKILGDSLGISSFWILFAILLGGKFFGFIGLIIGVPLFVLIYSIIKEVIEMRLQAKGLPIATKHYGNE
ncbi:AI-2E family transporter [Desulfosporosinus meridiei]|uniref:Putative permease n=1 Tax=Desulfosporosinus meridiei (strain ATCC BAA-275 / DSM 13257 / KCTC 12902 / NCIMB 13706 / S10) TaxID=768704 RepID=J7J274_DESMD|nr:AI-2E family transporter [Desulfosporosinus meridiei]AFQ45076.1 putative permease [Desulfosporosinus meridiei DSM 13257]